ncbi:hypothetical protein DL93DRAFT_2083376 [Clavulina sp. PMI_390]|nr:hypothetical protein DL93DRAFT_2083376 [Clavulina sp. PMI_390]
MFPTFVYETSEVSLVEVQLQSPKDEKLYEKGEHRFSFALIVPSSSATYDRSAHGKIRHSVKAVAFSEGLTGGSNIDARTPIYLIANPAPDGETSDLNVRVEGFKEELGPYAMAIAAQHLTVGGLLHFEALLASVPIRTQIVSVSATLVANYTLRSVQQPSQAPQFAAKRTQLFVFDAQHPPCPETHMLVGDSEGGLAPTGPPAAGTSLQPVESSHSTNGDPSARSESSDRSGTLSPSISRGSSIRAPLESSTHSQSTSTISMASGSGSTRLPSNSPTISRLHHPSTTPVFNRSKGKEPLLPMTTIEPGGSYQVTHLARLPNDDIIRPSTLEGTKTPIETKHELILEIHFNSVGEDGQPGKLMVLRTEHAITLSSPLLISLSVSSSFHSAAA